jgi:hypothetical protein
MGNEVLEFLEHHGVKGQKWGIRNEKALVGSPHLIPSRPSSTKTKSPSIHVDEAPWSNYKESDYTPAQWHNAALIHDHPPGVPTTKNHCKLPIKTPSGVVNRHGVYAAAAVLAGSRGGVHATSEQKASAAAALRRVYSQMGAEPPPSLKARHSDINEFVSDFLEHHGVKGQKWGIRHTPVSKARAKKATHKPVSEHEKVAALRHVPVWALTDDEIRRVNNRLQLESQFYKLNPTKVHQGRQQVKNILETAGLGVAAYSILSGPLGKGAVKLGKRVLTHK